jgi:ABC-type branched-subunit amino acid transport system substrate-binding protein
MLKRIAAGLLAMVAAGMLVTGAAAQSGEPIKIGFGMALTGPLAANGKQALVGMKIWEAETNAKGGLLGRPVKLIYYDDQTNPSTIPGIYTKLLDVDKVDLILGPYGTNMMAPAMPVVMQKGKTFITLFGLDVNHAFQYPKYFAMIPTGPNTKSGFTEGFFQIAAAQNPKPETVGLVAADAEFSNNACEGARANAKTGGWGYAYIQVLSDAIQATKSLNDDKLAEYLSKATFKTIMGDVKFGKGGEWDKGRMMQVQYHDIKPGAGLDTWRGMDYQTVLTPSDYKTGNVIYPYEKAKM